jgi:carbon storage regulator
MLVLTRKTDEAIVIGNDVHVTVLSIQGRRVRLGISAPAQMAICRSPAQEAVGATTPGSRTRQCPCPH